MNRFASFSLFLPALILSALGGLNCYHVSWGDSFKKSTVAESPGDLADQEIRSEEAEESKVLPEEVSVPASEVNPTVESSVNDGLQVVPTEEMILSESSVAEPDTVYIYPKFEPNGIASFSCAMGALGVVAASVAGVTGIGFFLVPLLIAGFILGIISVTRYKRTPELYRNNALGIIGLVISAIGIAAAIFTFIMLLVIFSNW